MAQHAWVKSTYGHGETMCSHCGITNREAAVLGGLNECNNAPIETDAGPRLKFSDEIEATLSCFSEDLQESAYQLQAGGAVADDK